MKNPLMQRWIDFAYRSGSTASVSNILAIYSEISEGYSALGRHYHTLKHISNMLENLDQYFPNRNAAIELAIWFHDYIYDPSRTSNELDSARAMTHLLSSESNNGTDILPSRLVELASLHIVATKDHQARGNPDSAIVCDLDLAPLAVSKDEYRNNTNLIRMEYAGFSDFQWSFGRLRFIESYLARPIYQTTEFEMRYEATARKNLLAERLTYIGDQN